MSVPCFLYPSMGFTKLRILRFCQQEARTRSQIVEFIGMVPSAVHKNIRSLVASGHIEQISTGYRAKFKSVEMKPAPPPTFKKPRGRLVMGVWL